MQLHTSYTQCRMGEVEEVMGVVDHPLKRSRDAESLSHAISLNSAAARLPLSPITLIIL